MDNRPNGREKNVTGQGKGLYKRGDGLNTGGPVGKQDGYQGRKQQSASGGSGGNRAGGGRSPLMIIIALVVLLLGGGGAGLGGLFGGSGNSSQPTTPVQQPTQQTTQNTSHYGVSGGTSILNSLLGGSSVGYTGGGNVSTGWMGGSNTGRLNTSVASGARAKRTKLLGGGRDTITIMVYMCGADLESRNAMASSDLQEMLNATTGTNINIIVYTGGCRQWKNNLVSSSVNQVYRIQNGQIDCLVKDDGSRVMTDPNTLARFIKFCGDSFPANRNMLIFWDHGGGSISGYGYDEKSPRSGSMGLSGINQALAAAGVTFDAIGFDTCLMATLETGLMLEPYADYMIASEETEPGVGWFYTNWLTELGRNPSMSTLELGKKIVDDFVSVCAQKCRGQKTTLSVVDLAELSATVPGKLKAFAAGTSQLMQSNQYQVVSNARGSTREFASSNKIDQVDLVHLALNLNTSESKALANALLGAVKYNGTSSNMTNAYGLSIYFPYQKASKVTSAVAAYEAIGMDSDYARCIQQFASMEVGGQTVAGGVSSPLTSLTGGGSSGGQVGMDAIVDILGALMGGGSSGGFYGRTLDLDDTASFIADHQFDAGALVWTTSGGVPQMRLSEDQWALVHDLQLNVFFDDGEGYIDLGLDNVYQFTEDGALLGEYDGTWLAIDEQVVAYYYVDSVFDGDSYTITGRVPVMITHEGGEPYRAELIIVFDNDHPYGTIAGARAVYVNDETDTVPKGLGLADADTVADSTLTIDGTGLAALTKGDKLDFICDYYSYDGDYQNSYYLGEQMTYTGDHEISNVTIDKDAATATYLFTDIYCQEYWTPVLP
ncbi:MAG: peptidase C11 [Oscillospiraceae bacterium]|nr:peptidase C11 [Oscillospiraceae bacterium]